MSWGTCYSGSNNIHFDYPALMSDTRLLTNWNPACDINKKIVKDTGIKTNYQYRQYLIHNANRIQKSNNVAACDQCGVCNYGYPFQPNSTGKYLYKSCSDMSRPYGYECSDLKNAYLSRQELESRMVAPLMSQQGYLSLPNAN